MIRSDTPLSSSLRAIRPLPRPVSSSKPTLAAVPPPKPVPCGNLASDSVPRPKPLPLPSPSPAADPWPYPNRMPSSNLVPDPTSYPRPLPRSKAATGRFPPPNSPPWEDPHSTIPSRLLSLSSPSPSPLSPACTAACQAVGEILTKRTIDCRAVRRNTTRLAPTPVQGANAPAGSETTASMRNSDTSAFLTCRSEPSRDSEPSGNATTALPPERRFAITCCRNRVSELRLGNRNRPEEKRAVRPPQGGVARIRSKPSTERLRGRGLSRVSLSSRPGPSIPASSVLHNPIA